MADLMIVLVIGLCLAGIAVYFVRKRKSGNTGCSCGCSGCSSKACCHEKE